MPATAEFLIIGTILTNQHHPYNHHIQKKKKKKNSQHQTPTDTLPIQHSPPVKALPASRPHVLQVTIALRQAVQRVIALAACAQKAAQSVGLVLAGVAAGLVDLGDGDLDGAVVVGLDDAVGGRALAGDVAGFISKGFRLRCQGPG